MSLQGARAAAERALERDQSQGNTANTSNTPPTPRFSTSRRTRVRMTTPSPPPSYTSGLYRQEIPAIQCESTPTTSGLNFGVWIFFLILLLIFIALYLSRTSLAEEPATHERLGQLLMEGVCRDMTLKRCMVLVKAGKVG